MKTSVFIIIVIATSLCITIASAQPVVTPVSNAASESLALSAAEGASWKLQQPTAKAEGCSSQPS